MKFLTASLVATVLLVSTPVLAASQQNGPSGDLITAENPDSVLNALRDLGYAGKLNKLDSGRSSIKVTISGLPTYVDFYECADDFTNCDMLILNATLDLADGTNLDKANNWNGKKLLGRVALDDDKDPILDFTLITFDGLTKEVFEHDIQDWDRALGDFKDFFDF